MTNTAGTSGSALASLLIQNGGTVALTGPITPTSDSRDLTVGAGIGSVGTLDIETGGSLTDDSAVIGDEGTGTVTVNGAGSTWTSLGEVEIGVYGGSSGSGTVNITNGGVASSAVLQIGIGQGAVDGTGTLNVSGAGSVWSNTLLPSTYGNAIELGFFSGSSGTITISNGGQVINSGTLTDNQWGVAGYAIIGLQGTGTVTVTDPGSAWTNTGAIYVGTAPFSPAGTTGTSSALTIENGGVVASTGGILGGIANNTGTVNVTGTNSSWTMTASPINPAAPNYNTGTLAVGWLGTGVLNIAQGSTVSDTTGFVGYSGAGANGTVTVSDPGSTWANSAGLIVGYQSTGAARSTVAIRNGGTVTDGTYGYIGYSAGANGTVTVTGIGSTWTMGSTLAVGVFGGTGTLTVQGGGLVSSGAASATIIANNGTGTVNVLGDAINDGNNGILQTAQIQKGPGTATLNLNGGILRATLSIAQYITNFPTLALGANGVFFDSNGYAIGVAPVLTSTGGITKIGAGSVSLTGTNTYSGATNVNAGTLYIDGNQSGATGLTSVANGGTLSGVGTIGGSVSVANGGTLAPGDLPGPGTLTINGNLNLSSGSILSYRLGQANANNANTATGATGGGGTLNDLVNVGGNVVLAGTLNVNVPAGGTFAPGIYRLINYNGTLTGNDASLALGTMPAGSVETVQTAVANQVNLVVTTGGQTLTYWDGAITTNANNGVVDGGNGTWQNSTGNSNWTNSAGTLNAPWTDSAFAVFEGTPGTVTVDNGLGQVTAGGMQFAANGYVVTGGPIALVETGVGTGQTTIQVGDGAADGAGYTATIAAVLQGTTALVKTDLGTLALSGINTYTGATAVDAGTLALSGSGSIAASSGVTVASGATLKGNGSSTVQALTLNGTLGVAGTATVGTGAGGFSTFTVDGPFTGSGGTVQINTYLDANPALSDVLTLTGSIAADTGTTTLAVTNVGGPGGQTTGNGILLVSYAGTVPDGATPFALASGSISAGEYVYTLEYVAGQGWFLQATARQSGTAGPSEPVPSLSRIALAWLALLLVGLAAAVRLRRRADRA